MSMEMLFLMKKEENLLKFQDMKFLKNKNIKVLLKINLRISRLQEIKIIKKC